MKNLLHFVFACILVACTSKKETTANDRFLPPAFAELVKQHGGLEQWSALRAMEFDVISNEKREHHIIDLQTRQVLISADSFKIGSDGKNVWVSPNLKAFKGRSARFYHSLFFYFFSIPFVLADSGVHYTVLEDKSINGTNYKTIQCSFGDGVGDADNDVYLLYIHPDSNRLEYLQYAATYFSGKPSDKFNTIHYQNWVTVEGIQLPSRLQWMKFENGMTGESFSTVNFENVVFKKASPPQEMFQQPEEAEIDSVKTIR